MRRLTAATAVAYAAGLVLLAILLRVVGESWWVTGICLYVPRLLFALPLPFIVAALVAHRMRRLLATQALALLVIVFPLMGFVPPRPSGMDRQAPVIRVLSYNVNHAYDGVNRVVEEIDRFRPDVVLLQELVANVEPLARLLRTRYPTVESSTQFLIATRFPILSTHDPSKIPHEGEQRSARFVQHLLDTPLGRIAVYNVHPVSPRWGLYALRSGGFKRGLLSGELLSGKKAEALQHDAGLRVLQLKAVAAMADREPYPVIIAGDTNVPGMSPLLPRVLGRYHDGFGAAGWGLGYTFPRNRLRWMRVDRVLAGQPLRFVGFEVGDSDASDHSCVVADLQKE